jgi:DnaJ-class molecular chaperone
METYYNLLEVKSSMSIKEIKKQYIKLMKKNHPDRSGQDEECKKITEAYQKIVQYKLNMNYDDGSLIPLEFTEFDNTSLDMNYVHHKIKLSNKKLEKEVILELKDIKRNDKSVFEKVFDYFFDLDSDEDSENDCENSD